MAIFLNRWKLTRERVGVGREIDENDRVVPDLTEQDGVAMKRRRDRTMDMNVVENKKNIERRLSQSGTHEAEDI